MMALRWGIVSCGKISHDFTNALTILPAEEHKVVGVAARNLKNAQEFAKKFDIPKAYGSYEELAKSKDLDVAYIGSIHPQHASLCKLFISHGCNILCEKPMTMNSQEAREVLALAKEKNVFFMEAAWSRFFPIYEELREILKSGSIGEVKHVTASFGVPFLEKPGMERVTSLEQGGGSIMDLGFYPVQFAQHAFGHEKPHKIVATGFVSEKHGVDETVTATLHYSKNRMAIISSSVVCHLDQYGNVFGSKEENNAVRVPTIWAPERMESPGKSHHHPLPKARYPPVYPYGEGMHYEAKAVRWAIQKGLKEHPLMTWQMSLDIQEIFDEIRKQIGLKYKSDRT